MYDIPEDTPDIGTNKNKCDHCGIVGGQVFESCDPFIAEIYPDQEKYLEMWCRDCYDERQDDI